MACVIRWLMTATILLQFSTTDSGPPVRKFSSNSEDTRRKSGLNSIGDYMRHLYNSGSRISPNSEDGIRIPQLSLVSPKRLLPSWYTTVALRRALVAHSLDLTKFEEPMNTMGRQKRTEIDFFVWTPTHPTPSPELYAIILKTNRILEARRLLNKDRTFRDSGECFALVRDLGRRAFILHRSGDTQAYETFYNNEVKPVTLDRTRNKSFRRRLFRVMLSVKDGTINSTDEITGCPVERSWRDDFPSRDSQTTELDQNTGTPSPAGPIRQGHRSRSRFGSRSRRPHRIGTPIYTTQLDSLLRE